MNKIIMQDNGFAAFNESHVEEAALSILEVTGLEVTGYTRAHGPAPSRLRDALLPELLSGRLRVPDAEAWVDANV